MPFVAVIDTAGIQEFIYRSNELRSIAEASRFLKNITEENGIFYEAAQRHSATIIMAAGGNMALRADQEASLKAVCKDISYELLKLGNGLEIVAAIRSYQKDRLSEGYLEVLAHLEQRKLTQPRSVPFTFPGLVSQVVSKHLGSSVRNSGYVLPTQTDTQLILRCPSEESDLMAVISLDGIGMGRKLFAWMQSVLHDDARFEEEFRCWSEFIKKRWDSAWERAIVDLERAFPAPYFQLDHPQQTGRTLQLWYDDDGNPYLPCRKIYQGGDDMTFLCDARISLGFTRKLIGYLEELPQESDQIPVQFHKLSVSAGVVFVDAHFPFRRAALMAEQLQKRAKKDAMELSKEDPPSLIDWWLNRSGALDRPKETSTSIKSAVRPTTLDGWDAFEQEILTGSWKLFSKSRNKLKALAEAAQDGPEAVKEFLALRGVPDPEDSSGRKVCRHLDFLSGSQKESGFNNNGRTALIDLVELFDIHFPLPLSVESEGGITS